jgi:hypothetical protein
MGHAVPVEDLLLLLGSDTIVLIEKIEERALWFFEGGVCTGLEVTQVRENALLEFFRVLHRAAERMKAERETSDDICP